MILEMRIFEHFLRHIWTQAQGPRTSRKILGRTRWRAIPHKLKAPAFCSIQRYSEPLPSETKEMPKCEEMPQCGTKTLGQQKHKDRFPRDGE